MADGEPAPVRMRVRVCRRVRDLASCARCLLAFLLEVLVLQTRVGVALLAVAWSALLPPCRKSVVGRTVLVTGAAGGLGRQMALGFARLGARLLLWDIDQTGNEETRALVAALGADAAAQTVDVRCRAAVRAAARDVGTLLPGGATVELLVNNAGVMKGRELLDLTEDDIADTFSTNTVSHFWTVQAFLPDMMASDYGHVVNISSMSGIQGAAMVTDYSASKFAVLGFTEALEDEIHRKGFSATIRTTVACPYMVNTGLLRSIQHRVRPRARFDRIMEADEVAARIIDGVLRDERIIYVPGKMMSMTILKALLPSTAIRHITTFADTGFFPVDDEEGKKQQLM